MRTHRSAITGAERSIRVSGDLTPDGGASLDRVFEVSADTRQATSEGSGTFGLELRDESGGLLFARRFEPHAVTHAPTGTGRFNEILPATSGTSRLEVVRGSETLLSLPVSPTAPQVVMRKPRPGTRWAANGRAIVAWIASDADGDRLAFRVQASPDGTTWHDLAGTLVPKRTRKKFRATIDLSTVPGEGAGWSVRVQASDGFNVGTAAVGPVEIAPKPPQVLITEPWPTTRLVTGHPLDVQGNAADVRGGPIGDDALAWSVDGAIVGQGTGFRLRSLDPGRRWISLSATSAAGVWSEANVPVAVVHDRACDADASICDDGDTCTVETCEAGACAATVLRGVPGVHCSLDGIATAQCTGGQLSEKIRRSLRSPTRALRRLVDRNGGRRPDGRADALLAAMARRIQRATDRGLLPVNCAGEIIRRVDQARRATLEVLDRQ